MRLPAPDGRLDCCKTTRVSYPAGSPVSLTHGAACAKPALILPEHDKYAKETAMASRRSRQRRDRRAPIPDFDDTEPRH